MATHQYYYCPFDADDVDGIVKHTGKKYAEKGNERCVVCVPTRTRKFGSNVTINTKDGCLKDVPRDAVLLIDGHGSTRGANNMAEVQVGKSGPTPVIVPAMGGGFVNEYAALTPYWLAKLLEAEGLGREHLAVRMLTCYGAGPQAEYTGSDTKAQQKALLTISQYQADDFFARGLAVALHKLDYTKVCVAGYLGPTQNVPGFKTYVEPDASTKDLVEVSSDRSRYMRWYDGQGKVVPKPTGLRSGKTAL